MKYVLALAGLAAAALPLVEARAQVAETVRVRPGIGVQTKPRFIGAGDNDWSPYFSFSIARGDKPFGVGAPDDGLSPKLVGSGGFRAGPSLGIQGSRKESEVGAPVGKIGTTVEVGAFAEHRFGAFRVRGQARKGIGGHEGIVGHVGADYILDDGDRSAFTLGPRLLFSDGRYQRAYFGVTPEVALATGLAPHRPGGGLHAVAGTAGMRHSLGGPWGLFGYARYERLVGDAGRSPIVQELGSPNQFSAGLGISHSFTLRL